METPWLLKSISVASCLLACRVKCANLDKIT